MVATKGEPFLIISEAASGLNRLGGTDGWLVPSSPYSGDGALGGVGRQDAFHGFAGILNGAGNLYMLLADDFDIGVLFQQGVQRL